MSVPWQAVVNGHEFECPRCEHKLVLSDRKEQYETLDEHICDPNSEPIEKPIWLCKNKNCVLSYDFIFLGN